MRKTAFVSWIIMLSILLYGCKDDTESTNVLSSNLLAEMTATTESEILELYNSQIKETINAGVKAYSVNATTFDLNKDGNDEIIAYFISSLNSGSLGNINVDIWTKENGVYKNIGIRNPIYLNPHLDGNFENTSNNVSLQVVDNRKNNFYDLWYITVTNNGTQKDVLHFNGINYE